MFNAKVVNFCTRKNQFMLAHVMYHVVQVANSELFLKWNNLMTSQSCDKTSGNIFTTLPSLGCMSIKQGV